jgi:hypothetical protein
MRFHSGQAIELLWAEKIGELESNSTRQCRVCGNDAEANQNRFSPKPPLGCIRASHDAVAVA